MKNLVINKILNNLHKYYLLIAQTTNNNFISLIIKQSIF